jgi:hypothetical protein
MKMKIRLIMFGLAVITLTGCSGMRRLSGDEFVKKAEIIAGLNSAIGCQYIGITARRAYLEYWDVFGLGYDRTIVYWTPLAELPSNVVARLKAGDPPWKPPMRQTDNRIWANNVPEDTARKLADPQR